MSSIDMVAVVTPTVPRSGTVVPSASREPMIESIVPPAPSAASRTPPTPVIAVPTVDVTPATAGLLAVRSAPATTYSLVNVGSPAPSGHAPFAVEPKAPSSNASESTTSSVTGLTPSWSMRFMRSIEAPSQVPFSTPERSSPPFAPTAPALAVEFIASGDSAYALSAPSSPRSRRPGVVSVPMSGIVAPPGMSSTCRPRRSRSASEPVFGPTLLGYPDSASDTLSSSSSSIRNYLAVIARRRSRNHHAAS